MTPAPEDRKATSTGIAVACTAFCIAMLLRQGMLDAARPSSADSGMMAGLGPLFWVIRAGILLGGAGAVSMLTGLAGAVAVRFRSAWAGAAAGAVACVFACIVVYTQSNEPAEDWPIGLIVGVPVILGAFIAGTLASDRSAR